MTTNDLTTDQIVILSAATPDEGAVLSNVGANNRMYIYYKTLLR